MSGLNKIMLLGNLGQDAELKYTQNGEAMLKFSLACSESYLDRNRVRQERTEWIRCVVWGRRAEGLAKILHKGSRIYCEGKIVTRSWEGDDGQKRYMTEVQVQNVVLGGGNKARNSPNDPEHRRPGRRDRDESDGDSRGGYDDSDYGSSRDDEEIPF